MRRLLVVLLFVAMSVVLVNARPAYACTCGQTPHFGDVVFVGVAEHVDGLPLFGGDPELNGGELTTRFRVESVLGGGTAVDHLDVKTEAQGTACGFVFEKGYRYEVYVTDGWTNSCAQNVRLDYVGVPESRAALWLTLSSGTAVLALAVLLTPRRRRRRAQ